MVATQSTEIADLKAQINQTNTLLAKLVPGFADAAGVKMEQAPTKITPVATSVASNNKSPYGNADNFLKHDVSNVVVFELSNDQITGALDMARAEFIKAGVDVNNHPFWKKIAADAGYKSAVMEGMKEKLRTALHTHKEVNSNPALQVK